ncbi:MAG: AMP-binding protein [Oscillospiraceae bacterium]|jgi:long-chain acyl-CoA synthetase|nr:AMP-binding protein [Oscillospiraceae bacterium]
MKNKRYPYYEFEQAGSIWDLLMLSVQNYGAKDVFVFKRGKALHRKTYAELSGEAHALAAYFIQEGYVRQKIAILGENSYDWIVSWFGIVLSGNIAVPIDKLLLPEQVVFILNDVNAAAVVHSKQYTEIVPETLEDGTPLRRLCMETDLTACVEQGAARLQSEGQITVANTTGKDETALIIYTSGTTGIAKGVALTQDNLCADMNSLTQVALFEGKGLLVLPLNHVYAFQSLLVFMAEGVTTYISVSLKRVSQELKEYQPSAMCVVPLFLETMYGKVMASAQKQGIEKQLKLLMKLSLALLELGIDVRRRLFKRILDEFGGGLSTVICGGAPIDIGYVRAFRAFGVNVMPGYGITECSPVIAGSRNEHHRDGSVGQPIPGAEIRTDAPDGEGEGELLVRGRMVMHGYYNNEAATREAFDGEWFKTGDIGYLDKDGFVYITGRKKNIIILSNGKNLYPEELEIQLMKIPAVSEVVVYEYERQVAAEIFPNADWLAENEITDTLRYLEQVVEKLNKHLPLYKNITKLKLRDIDFPKTSTQKIRRNK